MSVDLYMLSERKAIYITGSTLVQISSINTSLGQIRLTLEPSFNAPTF
jgi:hypothetical protein